MRFSQKAFFLLSFLAASLHGVGSGADRAPSRHLVGVGTLPQEASTRISFCSPTDGWAFSDDSIWATKNGGHSWQKLPYRIRFIMMAAHER